MIHFGKKEEFSITANYYYISQKDNPEFIEHEKHYKLGGSVYFWVKGKNLFEFKDCGPDATYDFWDLTILIDFFTSNFIYHISDDPFPKKTKTTIAIEKFDEVSLVPLPDNDIQKWAELDWDKVDMKTEEKIDLWNFRHGLLPNRG